LELICHVAQPTSGLYALTSTSETNQKGMNEKLIDDAIHRAAAVTAGYNPFVVIATFTTSAPSITITITTTINVTSTTTSPTTATTTTTVKKMKLLSKLTVLAL
jgi:hypothetical protein